MKDNVERSDPVALHTEVTPEQLDNLHAGCDMWTCKGYEAHQARQRAARVQRDMASTTASLERVSAALSVVAETARVWTRARARENLQAGLQHQRLSADWNESNFRL